MFEEETTRRWRLGWALAAFIGLSACGDDSTGPGESQAGTEGPSSRPHVVVLIADDLGRGDVGFTGGDIATPRLDALAVESIVLDRFYAAPMCSPARAQLMTGRNALALGLTRNVKPKDDAGIPADVPTVAERLSAAGYSTAFVGKWHLGHGEKSQLPRARGFDQSYGHVRGWVDYYGHDHRGTADWHRNGEPLEESGYSTDLIADEAARVIRAHDSAAPLLLVVSFNAPHLPLQAPPGWSGDRSDPRAVYAAMVTSLDEGVGRVLDALDERGLADETLVLFFSDNGGHINGGGNNGPLAGQKYDCAEGGIRTPACLRLPGRLAPGRSEAFVGTIDIAPTLIALAGAGPLPRVDGADVLPHLERGAPLPARSFVFAVDHARVSRRALLRPPHKLVEITREGRTSRTLHDVAQDPLERHDLAGSEPALMDELLKLAPWR